MAFLFVFFFWDSYDLNVGAFHIVPEVPEVVLISFNSFFLTADLSIETLQARREWQVILKLMKVKNLQPRLLYPAKVSFRYKGEIKSSTDKQKLREFSTTKPALQQMLKGLL